MPRTSLTYALAGRLGGAVAELARTERVGADAVHIPTWERHLRLAGEPLVRRTYRPGETEFSAGRGERLAARLAGKEAVLKVLGTGIRGVGLHNVEILSTPCGRPEVVLHGPAKAEADRLGLTRIEVSLCHEQDYALAVAVGIAEVPR
jgi:holo-[acyl-carrier protein] synthase